MQNKHVYRLLCIYGFFLFNKFEVLTLRNFKELFSLNEFLAHESTIIE